MEEVEATMKTKFEGYMKGRKAPFSVIPANPVSGSGTGVGIQDYQEILDPGFRRGDALEAF